MVGPSTFEDENNQADDYLPDESKTWAEAKSVVNKTYGNTVSFDYVYKKIGQLIDNGNMTLQLLQSIDPDVTNPATLGATASLMNSIRGCISEFTKIHQQYIKFQNMIQLEKIKLENKKEILRYKKDLVDGKLDSNVKSTDLFEIKSNTLLDFVEYQREKENKNE